MLAPLIVFILSFALIAFARPRPGLASATGSTRGFYLDRQAGAVLGALGMVLCEAVSTREAIHQAVNFETLILLFSMMVVCAYMAEARLFRYVSYLTLTHVRSARRLLVAVVLVSGLLSAILVNDTVCLMTTPLVVQCCRDARLRPLPFLLAICFGANAGSAATPTGNPQNMIIGTLSHIPYTRFVWALGLPALVSLLVVCMVLLWLFRRELSDEPLPLIELERPNFDPQLAGLCLIALLLIIVGFCAGYSMAWTALAGAALIILFGRRTPRQILERVDYVLLVFFAGLFVIVYGVGKAGIAEVLFAWLRPLLGHTAVGQAIIFGGFTLVVSQIVSNVPFVLLASHWMPLFIDPQLMWLSMALTATLAGNLTIVGSVANIIVLDGAGKESQVSFWQFLRYGAAVTLSSTALALLVLFCERRWGLF